MWLAPTIGLLCFLLALSSLLLGVNIGMGETSNDREVAWRVIAGVTFTILSIVISVAITNNYSFVLEAAKSTF